MSKLTVGPWPAGMDNLSPEGGLPDGAVRDALNMDFDRVGGAGRRIGRMLALPGDVHSLWASSRGLTYGVYNGAVAQFTIDENAVVAASPLQTLVQDGPVSFDDLLEGVAFTGPRDLGYIDASGNVSTLGVENPSAVTTTAETYGGLEAGRYSVAISFLRVNEESGLSLGSYLPVAFGGGIRIAVPQPVDPSVTAIRVYRTQANGDLYYRAADIPVGMTSYLLGTTPIGRQADNVFLERMDPGSILRYWRGRVLVARNCVLAYSQPLRYGLFDRRFDFIHTPRKITMVQPVDAGVFVGTDQGVVFLRGQDPKGWTVEQTGGKAPIAGTGTAVDAEMLGGDLKGRCALWLARNGFVIGTAEGAVFEAQKARIRIPPEQWDGTGSIVVSGRKAIAAVG